jgi:hypothetical protein
VGANRIDQHKTYLTGMGVRSWFGRYALAGAQDSSCLEGLIVERQQSQASKSGAKVEPKSISAKSILLHGEASSANEDKASSLKPVLRGEVKSSNAAEGAGQHRELTEDSASVSAMRVLPSSPSDSAQAFCVRLYACDDILVVLDSSDDASLSKERLLLENVLLAAFSKKVVAEYIAQCVWPLFELQGLNDDEGVGIRNKILRRFFALVPASESQTCLYFGRTFDRDSLGVIFSGMPIANAKVFPVSIFDCLNDSTNKKLLWRSLMSDLNSARG